MKPFDPVVPLGGLGRATRLHAGGFVLSQVAYRPGERMAPHFHEHASVTFVLAGEILESVGGSEEVAGPLSVVVKPAGVVHSDVFGPRGARTLQIGMQEVSGVEEALKEGWRWHHARVGVREFASLARLAAQRHPVSASTIEAHVWGVFGALAGADEDRGGAPPPWLARVRETLNDCMADRLDVCELARCAGVHPISLTRAFKRHFGETITGYRLRIRLRKAVKLVAGDRMSISSVAHFTGFADHPHLCREFRRATGLTPSDYRRLAGFGDGGSHRSRPGPNPHV